jgi:hypothetical protein
VVNRATRTLTIAQVCVLMGVVYACGGDDTASAPAPDGGTSSSGGADGGGDSGGLAPDAAPPVGCPSGCATAPPSEWKGPSAVWKGAPANKPSGCVAPYLNYEIDAHDGITAEPSECTCEAGVVVGAKCTATARVYTGASSTCTTKSGFNEVKVDSTACSGELGAVTDMIILASTLAVESNGTCSYQRPTPVRPAPKFDQQVVACTPVTATSCEGHPACASAPPLSAPFTRLCIFREGYHLCPSVDYPVRFVASTAVDDQRTCEATCAGNVTGTATCGTKWGFSTKNSAACTGGSTTHPETLALDECITVPNATSVVDAFKLAPTGLSCSLTTDTKPIGEAKSSGAITFCCSN